MSNVFAGVTWRFNNYLAIIFIDVINQHNLTNQVIYIIIRWAPICIQSAD